MGAIRNMNWTRLVPALYRGGLPETDSQVTKIRVLIGEGVHSLLPTRGVAFNFGATPVFILGAQPAPDSPGGAVPHLAAATDPGHRVIRVVRAMVA
jgi:hypothetical protein